MEVTNTYFKSLTEIDSGLGTKIKNSDSDEQIPFQRLENMLLEGKINPNTTHSKLKDRLCASYLTEGYPGSYRPEGILFQTNQKPSYCSAVDLMALTNSDTFTSSDYEGDFIEDSQELVFDSVKKMLGDYRNFAEANKILDELRTSAGLSPVGKSFEYNECCFEEPVDMEPIGLVGTSKNIIKNATKYDLPIYPTTQAYVNCSISDSETNNFLLSDFLRKSSVGALYRVGASFTLDALAIGMATGDFQSFFEDLDPSKLLRVAAYVVGINFVDYKFDVTNKLDKFTKSMYKK